MLPCKQEIVPALFTVETNILIFFARSFSLIERKYAVLAILGGFKARGKGKWCKNQADKRGGEIPCSPCTIQCCVSTSCRKGNRRTEKEIMYANNIVLYRM